MSFSTQVSGGVSPQQAAELRSKLQHSHLVTPSDPPYREAVTRWNAAAERPAGIVVFVASTEDVITTLHFARANGLDVAVRGGGHFTGPASSSVGGVVIDLRGMSRLQIDTSKRILRVGGGALWGDIDQYTTHHGLAAVVGTVSKTGVGGVVMGGGYGWLTGAHGLAVDNLVSARVVLADGRVVDASESENQDLFWALRGAGPNFGVVVEFTLRLHPQDWCVFAGAVGFPLERADDLVDALNALLPDLTGRASAMLVLANPAPSFEPVVMANVFYNGSEKDARRFFKPLFDLGPAFVTAAPIPFIKLNTLVDEKTRLGRRQATAGGVFRTPLEKPVFHAVREEFQAFVRSANENNGVGGVSVEVSFEFHNMTKVVAVPHEATAFPNRGSHQNVFIAVSWTDRAIDKICQDWANSVRDKLGWRYQASIEQLNGVVNEQGTGWYTNYNDGDIPAAVVFGGHYEKLRRLKGQFDPLNVFNKWYPIEPLASGESEL